MAIDIQWNLQQFLRLLIIFNFILLIINVQLKMALCHVHGHMRHHHGPRHSPKCASSTVSSTLCPSGMFSSGVEGPCLPCSLCGEGLYVAHRCQQDRDTVCDSCHTYMGPHNHDFIHKCLQPSTIPPHNISQVIHHPEVINRTSVSHYTSHPTNHQAVNFENGEIRSQHFSLKLAIFVTATTVGAILVILGHLTYRRKRQQESGGGYAAVAVADEL